MNRPTTPADLSADTPTGIPADIPAGIPADIPADTGAAPDGDALVGPGASGGGHPADGRRQYGVDALALPHVIEQTSRENAELLLRAVPGGRLMVRVETVDQARTVKSGAARPVWGNWEDCPRRSARYSLLDGATHGHEGRIHA